MANLAAPVTPVCRDTARTVLPQGSAHSGELSLDAQAELDSVLKKIANLGVRTAGKYQSSEYKGPLQKDLVNALKNNTDCKIEVFKALNEKLLAPANQRRSSSNSAAYWNNAWLTIRDRHRLYYEHYPQGYGSAANRADLLKILNRLDVSKDPALAALRGSLISAIKHAKPNPWILEHKPYYDIAYTPRIREAFGELEFKIRNRAIEHGVTIVESDPQ